MKLVIKILFMIPLVLADEYHPRQKRLINQKIEVSNENIDYWVSKGKDEIETAKKVRNEMIENRAKNIIIFVGDGMSLPTLTAARIYKAQMAVNFNGSVSGEETRLFFE